MKLTNLTTLLIAGLVLTLAASGCKHKTPPVTKFPGGSGKTGGEVAGPGEGGRVGGTGGAGSEGLSGIPQGPGHPGWPEDAETLKADTVYFDFDSSVVKDSEKSKVSAVADYLKSNSGNALKIAGHCDERGTEEYNRALGERRALALREVLVGEGVAADRVDTISYGKDRPAVDGHDEAAWSKNRRGEFIVLTPPK